MPIHRTPRRRTSKKQAKKPPKAIVVDDPSVERAARGQDETYLGNLGQMDERYEKAAISRKQPGRLVQVQDGRDPDAGSRISVHGINGNPNSVDALTRLGVEEGADTATFAYDDEKTRLDKLSDSLRDALVQQMTDNPNGPLTVDAHSMGTRITLDAVRKLVESGTLGDRDLNLNLVAPILAGITGKQERMTNMARMAPWGMGAIKGVRPGKDMGSNSKFQKRLNNIQFPSNVHTRLFTGGKDDIVDPNDERWKAMKERLNATEVNFKDDDHDSVINSAAAYMRRHDRK